jgi:8-oxo-dGTP diphosphatase
MKAYVAGFLFNLELTRVALVKKNKPDWQAGKWNAIGGAIEEGEFPEQAMSREFKEEAGLHIEPKLWQQKVILHKPTVYEVYFFMARSPSVESVKTMEEEEIGVFGTFHIDSLQIMPNLEWLIPLCKDRAVSSVVHVHEFQNYKNGS